MSRLIGLSDFALCDIYETNHLVSVNKGRLLFLLTELNLGQIPAFTLKYQPLFKHVICSLCGIIPPQIINSFIYSTEAEHNADVHKGFWL